MIYELVCLRDSVRERDYHESDVHDRVRYWARLSEEKGASPEEMAEAARVPLAEVYQWLGKEMPPQPKTLPLTFSEEDWDRIEEAAAIAGKPLDEFIRMAVLRQARHVVRYGSEFLVASS